MLSQRAVRLRLLGVDLLPVRHCKSVPCSTPHRPKPGCSSNLQFSPFISRCRTLLSIYIQRHTHLLGTGAQRHQRDLLLAAASEAVGLDRRGSQSTAQASNARNIDLHGSSSELERLQFSRQAGMSRAQPRCLISHPPIKCHLTAAVSYRLASNAFALLERVFVVMM